MDWIGVGGRSGDSQEAVGERERTDWADIIKIKKGINGKVETARD